MTIERSRGKARPTLPRASELRNVPESDADGVRNGEREANGRFAPKNAIGKGRGWKMSLAKLLGRAVDDPIANAVARDSWRTYNATLRELPNDGPTVRGLAAQHAHHVALAAFWSAQAYALGLATADGIQAQENATKHGQRAERLTVTMLDVATRLAAAKPPIAMTVALTEGLARVREGRGVSPTPSRSVGEPTTNRFEGDAEPSSPSLISATERRSRS